MKSEWKSNENEIKFHEVWSTVNNDNGVGIYFYSSNHVRLELLRQTLSKSFNSNLSPTHELLNNILNNQLSSAILKMNNGLG